MLVITLTDCPAALRGDLTRWLQEIDVGVYVGQVNARVREELWNRVKDNIKSGRATMVYSADNEQRMDFRVHNTGWEPIDFDGLKLMLRPSPGRIKALREGGTAAEAKTGFSNAAKMRIAKRMSESRHRGKPPPEQYAVVDVETTGLSAAEHEIIEIGAVKVNMGIVEAQYHALVHPSQPLSEAIEKLTGLSNEILCRDGREVSQAIPEFLAFVGEMPVVSHNAAFDFDFLRSACVRLDLPLFSNRCIDTLALARRLVSDAENYKLSTLLDYFKIPSEGTHRSLNDCMSTKLLYDKLIEIQAMKE